MMRTGTAPGAAWSFPPPTCTSWRAGFSPTTGPYRTRGRSRWASVWSHQPASLGTVRTCSQWMSFFICVCVCCFGNLVWLIHTSAVCFFLFICLFICHWDELMKLSSVSPPGLAEADENCKRFMDRCMPEAFKKVTHEAPEAKMWSTKWVPRPHAHFLSCLIFVQCPQLLTSSAVHKWGTEIHEGIYNMLMLLVELVAERVKQDPVPINLMGVLTMVRALLKCLSQRCTSTQQHILVYQWLEITRSICLCDIDCCWFGSLIFSFSHSPVVWSPKDVDHWVLWIYFVCSLNKRHFDVIDWRWSGRRPVKYSNVVNGLLALITTHTKVLPYFSESLRKYVSDTLTPVSTSSSVCGWVGSAGLSITRPADKHQGYWLSVSPLVRRPSTLITSTTLRTAWKPVRGTGPKYLETKPTCSPSPLATRIRK